MATVPIYLRIPVQLRERLVGEATKNNAGVLARGAITTVVVQALEAGLDVMSPPAVSIAPAATVRRMEAAIRREGERRAKRRRMEAAVRGGKTKTRSRK